MLGVDHKINGISQSSGAEKGAEWRSALYGALRTYRRGALIFEGQEAAGRIFYLAEGWAAIHHSTPDGGRQILGFRCAGEHFSNITGHSLAGAFAAECLSACRVGSAPAALLQEQENDPAARRLALEVLQGELRAAYEGLANLGRRGVRERIAHLLSDLVRRAQPRREALKTPVHLPISQNHVAEALGVTNVHLSRVLKDLRDDGVLLWGRRGVDVLDAAALARLAQR